MLIMKHLLIHFLFVLVSFGAVGCGNSNLIQKQFAETTTKVFPQDWTGTWSGDLLIKGPRQKASKVKMLLKIAALEGKDAWQWSITYTDKEGTKDIRNYEIYERDKGIGQYVIDEKNSILLEAFLAGDVLMSRFEVSGSLLLVTYQYMDEVILYEMISGKVEDTYKSGGLGDAPTVYSYDLPVHQTAVLKRVR